MHPICILLIEDCSLHSWQLECNLSSLLKFYGHYCELFDRYTVSVWHPVWYHANSDPVLIPTDIRYAYQMPEVLDIFLLQNKMWNVTSHVTHLSEWQWMVNCQTRIKRTTFHNIKNGTRLILYTYNTSRHFEILVIIVIIET